MRAEGQGLRQRTRHPHTGDALVRMPGARESVESLNAPVATTIALAGMASVTEPVAGPRSRDS